MATILHCYQLFASATGPSTGYRPAQLWGHCGTNRFPMTIARCRQVNIETTRYYLRHCLDLVDWTGRAIRDGKRGALPAKLEPILDRPGFDESSWLDGR